MKNLFFIGIITLFLTGSLAAQDHNGQRPPASSADRAKMTMERLSETVKFTEKQKSEMITIFTKFYDDAKAQQAFRDPVKLQPLEKTRDIKVEKLLNDKKLYKQYQDAMAALKAQMEQRRKEMEKQK